MSAKELRFECLGGNLYFSKFADDIIVLPIVEKIGDQIRLDRNQAQLLKFWLEEHLKEPERKPCGCYGPGHILNCNRKRII